MQYLDIGEVAVGEGLLEVGAELLVTLGAGLASPALLGVLRPRQGSLGPCVNSLVGTKRTLLYTAQL